MGKTSISLTEAVEQALSMGRAAIADAESRVAAAEKDQDAEEVAQLRAALEDLHGEVAELAEWWNDARAQLIEEGVTATAEMRDALDSVSNDFYAFKLGEEVGRAMGAPTEASRQAERDGTAALASPVCRTCGRRLTIADAIFRGRECKACKRARKEKADALANAVIAARKAEVEARKAGVRAARKAEVEARQAAAQARMQKKKDEEQAAASHRAEVASARAWLDGKGWLLERGPRREELGRRYPALSVDEVNGLANDPVPEARRLSFLKEREAIDINLWELDLRYLPARLSANQFLRSDDIEVLVNRARTRRANSTLQAARDWVDKEGWLLADEAQFKTAFHAQFPTLDESETSTFRHQAWEKHFDPRNSATLEEHRLAESRIESDCLREKSIAAEKERRREEETIWRAKEFEKGDYSVDLVAVDTVDEALVALIGTEPTEEPTAPDGVIALLAQLPMFRQPSSLNLEGLVNQVSEIGPMTILERVQQADAISLQRALASRHARCVVRVIPRANRREPIPERVRHEVWRRDGGACVDCGSRDRLEFDHIIPISQGGSNTARNIELRCESHNREKSDRI